MNSKSLSISAILLIIFLSANVSAKDCEQEKMTLKEWIEFDSTYKNYQIPKDILDSNACLVKPPKPGLVSEELEIYRQDDVFNEIRRHLDKNINRPVSRDDIPKILENLSEKYDVFLENPCTFPFDEKVCRSKEMLLVAFRTDPLTSSGRAFSAMDLMQFVD
ncbi:hypothetical protein [Lacimicrobium alkaliphilum]|uniref:Uncharacterized protein n=1 Tax=Lacimicrobium alkaliphilum TaxID=1526571 RepID=A0ABQ1RMF7_9ALTE|nr:hypothetical protein [Lacimicrobium alkaliphilum]GGD71890.1 hypothetical protein GCM10011357_28640 [Lacimicrobium alkaliphilum]